jgi:hypothetical protein
MEENPRMRVIPLVVLGFAGLAPAGALASGNGEEVMVVAGSRVTTTRGAFVAEDGAEEPGVVVLRGAEVGGAIPDPSSVERERRPFLPPMQSETDALEAPVHVRIVLPQGQTYSAWLPSRRGHSLRIRAHHGHPKHHKDRKHHKKGRGLKVAAAPPLWVSPTFGAPHSTRRLVGHRGGKSAKHRTGHGGGRRH